MRKVVLIMLGIVLGQAGAIAQQSQEAAFEKFVQLTSMFRGTEPYSCYAIAEVKYKSNANRPIRDTSNLIYKNGRTYYKSKLVEYVQASEGELTINHELKTVSFHVSDSINSVLQKETNAAPDVELESLVDTNYASKDAALFNKYIVEHCNVSWTSKDGIQELSFTPKNAAAGSLLSIKIRFSEDSKIRYYEYTNREAYATTLDGDSRFRIVRTIYDNFKYENVPDIPSRVSEFLEWKGWTVKLKKYTNYKLSVL